MKKLKLLLIIISFVFSTQILFAQQSVVLSLLQPPALEANVSSMDTSILAGNSISLGYNLNVTGGTGNFLYNWSGDDSIDNLTSVTPEVTPSDTTVYTCTIADENGCSYDVQYKVNVIFPINVNSEIKNISCNGEKDGTATISVMKGASPYNIVWSNGETGLSIKDLESGEYSVLVTDAVGQTFNDVIKISEPEILTPVFTKRDTIVNGVRKKFIDVTISGGTEPYSYLWSNNLNNLETEDIIIPDSTANYSVIVTDASGCTTTLPLNITNTVILEKTSDLSLDVFPNPNNGNFNFNVTGTPSSKIELTITGIDGRMILQKEIQNFSGSHLDEIQIPQVQGMYQITAKTPVDFITKRFIIR